jgi:hypothetical protein
MRKIILSLFLCGCATSSAQPKNYAVIGLYERPSLAYDFVTVQKIQVYQNSTPVTRDQVELAAEFFINTASDDLGLDRDLVRSILKGSTIEWTLSYIYTADSKESTMAMGAAVDKAVYVMWRGSIAESSLFHEWLHLIINAVTEEHDPEHQSGWWVILPGLKDQARALGL